MRPLARRLSQAVIAIVALGGVFLVWRNFLAQIVRLRLYLAQGIGFHDPACVFAYCDYSVFWLAGLLARHRDLATLYHAADFYAFGARMVPNHVGNLPYFYPPTALLPVAVATLPALAPGYYLFSAVTLLVSALLLRRAGLAWWCIVVGVLSPAALWNLYLGQFGFICAALLICGLACLEAQPVLAGVLLGLLCIKPQYALLVPVVVLAGRHWRALIAGAATLVMAAGISVLCFGWRSWAEYISGGRAQTGAILNAPFGADNLLGDSVFWMVRSFGAGLHAAYIVQGGSALLAVLVAWRLWRRDGWPIWDKIAATVCLTLLTSPYGYTDDLSGYSLLLPALARRDTPTRNALLAVLWIAPAFTLRFVQTTGISATPLLVFAALLVALGARRDVFGGRSGSIPTYFKNSASIQN